MPKTTNRSTELQTLLTQLNLGTMADVFADVALRAAKEGLSHEAYLYELARLEIEQRTQRRTARLVRASGLPVEKTFRTLALSSTLPKPAIAIGTPQKRILPGDGDEYYRDWQTRGREKSLPGSGWLCRDRGRATPCSGRPPARLSSGFWRRSGTCVCRKSWRNWTSLPASFSTILAMSSMIVTKWRCCLRSWLSGTNANR